MTRNLFFGCTFQVFMLVSIISHGIIPLFLLIGLYNKVYVAFSARSRRLASMTSRQRRYYVTWYKLSRSIDYRPTLHCSVSIQVTVQCSWTDKHWNSVGSAYVIPKKMFIIGDCLQALKIGLGATIFLILMLVKDQYYLKNSIVFCRDLNVAINFITVIVLFIACHSFKVIVNMYEAKMTFSSKLLEIEFLKVRKALYVPENHLCRVWFRLCGSL